MGVSRQQYFAIKESLSSTEKKLIDFYELQWVLRHHVPTVTEVATRLEIKETAVNYHLLRKPVITALDKRGIPWRQHSQSELTGTQVAAAVTMMNFADTRSNDEKLDQLGINPTQYYAWLNDPQFKNLIDSLSDQNLKNIKPTAIGEFTKLINKGDWQAVKYYLDVTGAATSNEAPRNEQLIRAFVEICQKHIKDPATIIAIANDVAKASANRTLEVVTPPQITGELVEDQELIDAKRKLGIG